MCTTDFISVSHCILELFGIYHCSVVLQHRLISDNNQKFSVITGTLLKVFGSCERHSELTEEMYIPLRPIPKEDTLCC